MISSSKWIKLTVFRNQWVTSWRLIHTFDVICFLRDDVLTTWSEFDLFVSSILIAIVDGSMESFPIAWEYFSVQMNRNELESRLQNGNVSFFTDILLPLNVVTHWKLVMIRSKLTCNPALPRIESKPKRPNKQNQYSI